MDLQFLNVKELSEFANNPDLKAKTYKLMRKNTNTFFDSTAHTKFMDKMQDHIEKGVNSLIQQGADKDYDYDTIELYCIYKNLSITMNDRIHSVVHSRRNGGKRKTIKKRKTVKRRKTKSKLSKRSN